MPCPVVRTLDTAFTFEVLSSNPRTGGTFFYKKASFLFKICELSSSDRRFSRISNNMQHQLACKLRFTIRPILHALTNNSYFLNRDRKQNQPVLFSSFINAALYRVFLSWAVGRRIHKREMVGSIPSMECFFVCRFKGFFLNKL